MTFRGLGGREGVWELILVLVEVDEDAPGGGGALSVGLGVAGIIWEARLMESLDCSVGPLDCDRWSCFCCQSLTSSLIGSFATLPLTLLDGYTVLMCICAVCLLDRSDLSPSVRIWSRHLSQTRTGAFWST